MGLAGSGSNSGTSGGSDMGLGTGGVEGDPSCSLMAEPVNHISLDSVTCTLESHLPMAAEFWSLYQ